MLITTLFVFGTVFVSFHNSIATAHSFPFAETSVTDGVCPALSGDFPDDPFMSGEDLQLKADFFLRSLIERRPEELTDLGVSEGLTLQDVRLLEDDEDTDLCRRLSAFQPGGSRFDPGRFRVPDAHWVYFALEEDVYLILPTIDLRDGKGGMIYSETHVAVLVDVRSDRPVVTPFGI